MSTQRTAAIPPRYRLAASRPPIALWLLGAFAWGTSMAISAILSIFFWRSLPAAHLENLLLLYFAGGALAWVFALPLIRFFAFRRAAETRFAAALLFLGLATPAMTAFLFAMQYRLFYAQWHEPFGTKIWGFQFVFTSAAAVYQFAVIGIRLLLPLGIVFLLAASALLSRRSR